MQNLLNKLKSFVKQLWLQPNSNTIIFLCLSLSFIGIGISYWLCDDAVITIAILIGIIGLIGVDIGYHKGRNVGKKEDIVTKIAILIGIIGYLSYRIIKHIYMALIFIIIIQYIT